MTKNKGEAGKEINKIRNRTGGKFVRREVGGINGHKGGQSCPDLMGSRKQFPKTKSQGEERMTEKKGGGKA